jgi:glycosyltransferase involved in cell wall biosynthesis
MLKHNTGWPWTTTAKHQVKIKEACWPKISIVTPSYNQGKYLEKTIRSVLLQNYPNLEFIIIDGGSTDNSVDIIKKYERSLTYWVSEKDRGQSHAINKGFERTTGELYCWLNSDDFLAEGALFKIVEQYSGDEMIGAIYGQGHIVDERMFFLRDTSLVFPTEQNLFYWFEEGGAEFMQPSCFITRIAWEKCGPLSEDLHFAMDLDLWLKISKKFKFSKVEDLLSYSIRHSGAKTGISTELCKVDVAIVYMRHGNEERAREILEEIANTCSSQRNELSVISKIPFLGGFLKQLTKLFRN